TSAWTKMAVPWLRKIPSTTACPRSAFSSTTTTCAPSRAKCSAIAHPIPEPPPVTMPTLSFNRIRIARFLEWLLNGSIDTSPQFAHRDGQTRSRAFYPGLPVLGVQEQVEEEASSTCQGGE